MDFNTFESTPILLLLRSKQGEDKSKSFLEEKKVTKLFFLKK